MFGWLSQGGRGAPPTDAAEDAAGEPNAPPETRTTTEDAGSRNGWWGTVIGRTSNGASTSGNEAEAGPGDIQVDVLRRQNTPASNSHVRVEAPPDTLNRPRGRSVELLGAIGGSRRSRKNVKWVDEHGKDIATVYQYQQQDPKLEWEPLTSGKKSCGCMDVLRWCFCHHKDDHTPMQAYRR